MTDMIHTADIKGLLKEKNVERLIEVLIKGGTRSLQMGAADALGILGDERAIAPLRRIIDGRYWSIFVRTSSVRALGTIGSSKARQALDEYTEFKDFHGSSEDVNAVREAAKAALKLIS